MSRFLCGGTKKHPKEIQHIVQEKLKEVELEKDGGKMPSQLSGGMMKRAGLARALVLDPSILLVDEPSSGLDRITATEIYDLLRRLKKNRQVTLVVVTHDVAGARNFADEFAVLDEGQIKACGSANELMHDSHPLFRKLAGQMEDECPAQLESEFL